MSNLIGRAIELGLEIHTAQEINTFAQDVLKTFTQRWIKDAVKETVRELLSEDIEKAIKQAYNKDTIMPLVIDAIKDRIEFVLPDPWEE